MRRAGKIRQRCFRRYAYRSNSFEILGNSRRVRNVSNWKNRQGMTTQGEKKTGPESKSLSASLGCASRSRVVVTGRHTGPLQECATLDAALVRALAAAGVPRKKQAQVGGKVGAIRELPLPSQTETPCDRLVQRFPQSFRSMKRSILKACGAWTACGTLAGIRID